MNIKELKKLCRGNKNTNPKLAAEAAYVRAMILRRKAEEAGRECLDLMAKTKRDTLEDCAPILVTLSGVSIPDIFHAEVVKRNLSLNL